MRKLFALVGLSVFALFAACGGEPSQVGEAESAQQVCTKMPIYCPPGCIQTAGGCPQQCHCPATQSSEAYTYCGPTLRCGVHETCCTAGPVNVDPALNNYSCNPPGTFCPL